MPITKTIQIHFIKKIPPPPVDRGTYVVHYDVLPHIFTVVQESNYF